MFICTQNAHCQVVIRETKCIVLYAQKSKRIGVSVPNKSFVKHKNKQKPSGLVRELSCSVFAEVMSTNWLPSEATVMAQPAQLLYRSFWKEVFIGFAVAMSSLGLLPLRECMV